MNFRRTFEHVGDSRSNNFDFLRFTLASLVVLSHSFGVFYGQGPQGEDSLSRLTRGQDNFGSLAVEGFFLISGFLITKSWIYSKNIKEFSKKRLLRIVPALAVVLLFIVFVVGPLGTADRAAYFHNPKTYKYLGIMFAKDVPASDNIPGVFAQNPWSNRINTPLWTIRYEVACYIILAALGAAGALRKRAIGLTITVALYALWALSALNILNLHHRGENLLYLLNYFLIGMVYYLYRSRIPYSSTLAYGCVAAILIAAKLSLLGIVLPIFGSYVLFYMAFAPGLKAQKFGRWGDFSYGTYLYAFPIQQLVQLYGGQHLGVAGLFVCSLLLTVGAAALSWHFVEEPFLRLKARRLIPIASVKPPIAVEEAPVTQP